MEDSRGAYVAKLWGGIQEQFAGTVTNLGHLTLGVLPQFLPTGTMATALILLWFLDLLAGTSLAIKVSNWDEDLYGPMPARLARKRFRAKRLPMSLIKLAMWLGLALVCSIFRGLVRADNPAFLPVFSSMLSLVEYTLVAFESHSILHNVAEYTQNSWLLQVANFFGRAGQHYLDARTGTTANPEPTDTKVGPT